MVRISERLVSLDVFRGITMAAMVLVENPGNWSIYWPFRHARWGMTGDPGGPVHEVITPTDLIMPFFLSFHQHAQGLAQPPDALLNAVPVGIGKVQAERVLSTSIGVERLPGDKRHPSPGRFD